MERTAYAYHRYSSDRQHESSIEAQELAINEWASRNGVRIVARYYDRAMSATTDNRPDFLRMITDLRTAPVDLVLVHKQDRFARNRYDAALYSHEIKQRGARLVCVAQDFGEGNEAVLLESLMQGLAEYYSKNLSTEVIKGRRIKIRDGLHAGGTYPFGYGPDGHGGYQIVESEAHYIRKLYDCVLTGKPYASVVQEMNAAGIKGRRGAAWKTSNISHMLRLPIYAGIYRARAGEEENEIPENHPAIISRTTYEEAMHIMEAKLNVGRAGRSSYLLQKLIVCQCGAPMHGHTQRRGERLYRSYICDAHCGLRSVPCQEVEKAACEYVNKVLSPELREQLVAALERHIRERKASEAARRKTSASQIAQLNAKIDAAVANMSSGVLPEAVLKRLSDQIASYEEQIRVLESVSAPTPSYSIPQIEAFFANASAISPETDFATTQATLRRFISRITVYEKKFVFESTFSAYFRQLLGLPADDPDHGKIEYARTINSPSTPVDNSGSAVGELSAPAAGNCHRRAEPVCRPSRTGR